MPDILTAVASNSLTKMQFHSCAFYHCRRCGECIPPPRYLCDVCREVLHNG